MAPDARWGSAASRSAFEPIVEPSTSICRKKIWRRSIFGEKPAVAPQVTMRPPHAVASTLFSNTSPPTWSSTASTPRRPVISLQRATKSSSR